MATYSASNTKVEQCIVFFFIIIVVVESSNALLNYQSSLLIPHDVLENNSLKL
jgi:hypothetical protein